MSDNDELLENIIMKFLYTDEKLRDKIVPYLKFSIFEEVENIELIKFAKKFMVKFKKFPNAKETRLMIKNSDTYRHLQKLLKMDTSEYTSEMILNETEIFIRQRCIMDVCYNIVEQINNDDMSAIGGSPDAMREAVAFSFDDSVGLDIFDASVEDSIYEQFHDSDVVIPTGLDSLDDYIEGGVHEKTLSLIMAETNMGKSLIMGALATNNVFMGKNVLYITCEMSEFKIGERVLANAFDMKIDDIKMLPKNKFGKCFAKSREKLKGKFVVKEYPTGVASVNDIRNVVKELALKKKFTPDIIYIDYIGIMSGTFTSKNDNTYTAQKRITEEVRGLAVELSIPIISAIQTNRGGMGKEELDMTNASDSIGTAFTADVIIGVTQTDELRAAGKYRFNIIKNRYGQNKVGVLINVNYPKMRLTDDEEYVKKNEVKIPLSDKKHDDIKTNTKKKKKNKLKNIIDA